MQKQVLNSGPDWTPAQTIDAVVSFMESLTPAEVRDEVLSPFVTLLGDFMESNGIKVQPGELDGYKWSPVDGYIEAADKVAERIRERQKENAAFAGKYRKLPDQCWPVFTTRGPVESEEAKTARERQYKPITGEIANELFAHMEAIAKKATNQPSNDQRPDPWSLLGTPENMEMLFSRRLFTRMSEMLADESALAIMGMPAQVLAAILVNNIMTIWATQQIKDRMHDSSTLDRNPYLRARFPEGGYKCVPLAPGDNS